MTNDDSEPSKAVVQATQGQEEPTVRIHNVSDVDTNRPRPSSPPESPTPPPGGTNGVRAPEPITLPEGYQSALRRAHTLETHNAKLYQDNCRLINTVHMLNDRLAFFGAPQNTQALRFTDMQEKLCISEANRVSVSRKYQELLHCISSGSAQHHFIVELQAIRDAYASLDREYRLLGDKYIRLKALVDTTRVAQSESHSTAPTPHVARGPIPVVRSEFHAHNQNWNDSISPTAPISSDSFLDQRGDHRRRSSESVVSQTSLRPGATPISTTCLAPLPTPPPSAPLSGELTSPTGFPVHVSVPARPLPLPHHPKTIYGSHTFSEMPSAITSRHLVEQDAWEQPKEAIHFRQYPSKRTNSELQSSASPGGERKKPRTEEETDHPTITNTDTYSINKTLLPPASFHPQGDRKLAGSDSGVRSYQDCVDLIFEKDADVENGVFCGRCLDRYEAKMILEPPDVLIRPNFDFLVRHCMTMHPTVWNELRRKV